MKLSFVRLVLGPLGNNVYLLADEDSKDAVIIDPSFGSEAALAEVKRQGWTLRQVWLTHGHYDHTTGAEMVSKAFEPHIPMRMLKPGRVRKKAGLNSASRSNRYRRLTFTWSMDNCYPSTLKA
jgi:glyoxylase-like metal-dependent hydrolase (beta-lactamase superfamily II)